MDNYGLPIVWSRGTQELSSFFYEIIDRSQFSTPGKRHLHAVMMENSVTFPKVPTLEAIAKDMQKTIQAAGSLLFYVGFFPDSFSEMHRNYYAGLGANLYERAGNVFEAPLYAELSDKFPKAANAITEIRIEAEFRSVFRKIMGSDIPVRADPHVHYFLKRHLEGSHIAKEVLKRLDIDISEIPRTMQ